MSGMLRKITKLALFSIFILNANYVFGQSDFNFQGESIKPGTKQHFMIPIKAGEEGTFLPVTVFNGSQNGPVLGITAGVHGFEYPPIIAAQELITGIKLDQLKGTIILVQVANVPGFLGRSPNVNPMDDKNLNREFPGAENGSITERIAHFITANIISRADFFLDMHGGDAMEGLMPYVGYYHNTKKAAISEKGKQMALSLGFDHIIVFNTDGKKYMEDNEKTLYCSAQAFKKGIPAVDIECGKLGGAEPRFVQQIVSGVNNMLKFLGMYEGEPHPNKNHIVVNKRFWIESEFDGIFYPCKSSGEYVSRGMEIGYITDFFGKELGRIQASDAGILLYLIGTPPVSKGETIAAIGQVD